MPFSSAYSDFDVFAVAWRLPVGLPIALRSVGDWTAVFNEESGDTHVLEPQAAEVLRRLAAGEILQGDDLRHTAEELQRAGFDPELAFRELHVMGLAEPVRP
jgi:PqqD family protein of HPr-rel-A system